MRKINGVLLTVFAFFALAGCSFNMTNKYDIIKTFRDNEQSFISAAASGNFESLKSIRGVQKIEVFDDHAEFFCGGRGFGSSTSYYGIFYSPSDSLCAANIIGSDMESELIPDDDGFRYLQPDGDNEYYVEPLGNHFFYYEAHF